MPLRSYPVKLTDEQVKAVEAAFPDSTIPFSEMLRNLVAGGLALYQVEWPPSPEHGGKRKGAGRKKERNAKASS